MLLFEIVIKAMQITNIVIKGSSPGVHFTCEGQDYGDLLILNAMVGIHHVSEN